MKEQVSSKQIFNNGKPDWSLNGESLSAELREAEDVLSQLASVFFASEVFGGNQFQTAGEKELPSVADTYRILVEQIPAVVFIAFFDKNFGETYVSPQIEATLGFTQEEWLNDPVRWYQQIHPEDKARWSAEAAQMFLTGEPLHSVYRVLARDGRVIWFQCEVKMVRRESGQPWFIHGVGFDITRRHENEEVLREYAERMKVLSRRLIEVQEAERRIIALELHDQIGQILTGLKLKLEMTARLPEREMRENLDESQTLVNELLTRTRELSLNLRPATLDHLGLMSALLRHFRHYTSQTQVKVDFQQDGLEGRRFSPEIETAAFRIVQETLTNIARHSQSEDAVIRIWANKNALVIQIEDHGKGFDTEAGFAAHQSSGLAGMRERVLLTGGNFNIESQLKIGTCLTAEWILSDDNNSIIHGK